MCCLCFKLTYLSYSLRWSWRTNDSKWVFWLVHFARTQDFFANCCNCYWNSIEKMGEVYKKYETQDKPQNSGKHGRNRGGNV